MKQILLLSLSLCASIQCIEKVYFGVHGKILTIDITDENSGKTTRYKRRFDGTFTKKVKINGETVEKTHGLSESFLRNSQELNGNKEMDTHFDGDENSLEE
jgi:hypothetical protein